MATINGTGDDDYIVGSSGADVINGGDGNDSLFSANGDDLVSGNNGNDYIVGYPGNDTLYGNDGDDALLGGEGGDYLDGGIGDDMLDGGYGNDALYGGDGIDRLNGLVGNDLLYGNNGDDIINGHWGNDALYGNDGNDAMDGGDGNDILDGGLGSDVLIGSTGNDSFYIDADDTLLEGENQFVGGIDTVFVNFSYNLLSNFENLTLLGTASVTGSGNDRDNILIGNTGDNYLIGNGGYDYLDGGAGVDIMYGGSGGDTYIISNAGDRAYENFSGADDGGDDRVLASVSYVLDAYIERLSLTGSDDINGTGNELNNFLIGNAGKNILLGLTGDDVIVGGSGDDLLDGGEGINRLKGGLGADTFMGTGFDYADYSEAQASVTVFLGAIQLNAGEAAGDVFVDVEGVTGSSYDDILYGTKYDNTIEGNAGNDWLFGAGGADYILGGKGSDLLEGGEGADTIDGGLGTDVVSYRHAISGITLDVDRPDLGAGEAAGDVLVNIENIWGSNFDDLIVGSDTIGGQVYGYDGNDSLDARGGNDVIYGGTGADTITTGAGADDIFYLSYNDHINKYGTLEANEGGDTITDFTHGIDHITLSRYWFGFGNITGVARNLTSDYADFITSGTTATSTKPTFFYDQATGQLKFDPDGTGQMDAVLLATLSNHANLTLSDIWTG